MVIKTVADINQYTGMSVNPMSNPEQIYELYSVPSFETRYPEIIKGSEIGSNKITIESGDILICKINPRINRVWVVEHNTEYPLLASSEWIVVRSSEIDSGYLKWYFSSPSFRTLLTSQVAGIGGSLTRAQPKQVATYPVPIPPYEQQQYIAAKLDKLDVLITLRKEQLAKLDELVKARFVEMFEDCSESVKLSDVAVVSGGLTKNAKRENLPLKIPYLRVANVGFDEIDISEMLEIGLTEDEYTKTLLQYEDLLFVEGNGSPDQIGRVAVWKNEIVPCVHQNHLIKARFDKKVILPTFALHYFMTVDGREQIKSKAVSTSGLYTLSVSKISDLQMPVPPMELQEMFTAFVEQTNKTKLTIQASLDKLEVMKKALMQEYFG